MAKKNFIGALKKTLNPINWVLFFHPKNLKKTFSRENLKKKFTWKNIKKVLYYGVPAFLIFILLLGAWIWKDLPSASKLEARLQTQSTKILDRNGGLLYEVYGDKKRTVVNFSNINETAREATIAIEDKNFYNHGGIDFIAIIRASLANVTSGQKSQGASTLTQQFVKNALLSPEKTFTRKIKEVIISIAIEALYSKDKILEMYLNEIPYGSNTYGIEAASQSYFGKSAKELSIAESAILASLPKAPTYYSPYGTHKDELLARKDLVIDKMIEQNYITKEEGENAKKQEIVFLKKSENIKYPHFVMYVREQLVETYGEKMVNEGGLIVKTSIDPAKQDIALNTIAENAPKNLKRFGAHNASLVSLDPKTGEVLAMVGSVDYFDEANDGQVNIALTLQEPGSSFKPYAYATAFANKGKSPATMLIDVETDFGNGYKPQNYDGRSHGIQSARSSLAGSLNIPAVKIMHIAGVNETIDQVEKMGITTLKDRSQYGLSLTLGGGSVKPLEHISAFSSFANHGVKHDVHPILKIEDSKGKVIFEYKKEEDKGTEVLPKGVAYQITNILSDNSARAYVFGSNSPLVLKNRPVAAKTGTTQDFRDGWTLGYTPSLMTGVWVGNNDNTPMKKGEAVYAAAPIWNNFMTKALDGTPVEQFERPSDVVDITVDRVSGLLPSASTTEFKKEIFVKGINEPKEKDNVHVNKTAECPAGPKQVVYTQLVPEIPKTDPAYNRWNAPIQAFANSQGYGTAPADECAGYGVSVNLDVSKTNPKLGEKITLTATPTPTENISKIEFYYDSTLIKSISSSPFTFNYDLPSEESAIGSHTLKAIAYHSGGTTAESEKKITITYDISLSLSVVGGQYRVQTSGADVGKISKVKIRIKNIAYNMTKTGSDYFYSYGGTTDGTVQAYAENASGEILVVSNNYPSS